MQSILTSTNGRLPSGLSVRVLVDMGRNPVTFGVSTRPTRKLMIHSVTHSPNQKTVPCAKGQCAHLSGSTVIGPGAPGAVELVFS